MFLNACKVEVGPMCLAGLTAVTFMLSIRVVRLKEGNVNNT